MAYYEYKSEAGETIIEAFPVGKAPKAVAGPNGTEYRRVYTANFDTGKLSRAREFGDDTRARANYDQPGSYWYGNKRMTMAEAIKSGKVSEKVDEIPGY